MAAYVPMAFRGFHSQLQIYSLGEIPVPEKCPSGIWPSLPRGSSPASLHRPAPWWLSSCVLLHLPPKPHTCKQSQGIFPGLLHLQGTHTPSAIKLQTTRAKSDSTTSDLQHPPLLCLPPDNYRRNSLNQTQELLQSALMSTDCLIFGLINLECCGI